MCFLRHLSEEDAFKTLEQALPFKDKIIAVAWILPKRVTRQRSLHECLPKQSKKVS
ncbi:adenosine deaminase [Vibrio sp. JCM 19236]|nr:adenosine deaminase [Vibrio sp. JCM 19236]